MVAASVVGTVAGAVGDVDVGDVDVEGIGVVLVAVVPGGRDL